MYGFIIDTTTYAGNFERQLCAYMTGHVGDCGVGEKYATQYLEEYDEPIQGVRFEIDETGCYRPVTITSTPNYFNNGMGKNYKDGQEELALQEYIKDRVAYENKKIDDCKKRKENYPNYSETYDNFIHQIEEKITRIQKITLETFIKSPAYQSVEIYFNTEPSKETKEFLKQRAYEFFKETKVGRKSKGEIIGFRERITGIQETIKNL